MGISDCPKAKKMKNIIMLQIYNIIIYNAYDKYFNMII